MSDLTTTRNSGPWYRRWSYLKATRRAGCTAVDLSTKLPRAAG